MSLLKKLFSKELSPEDQIGERIKSIIEICLEYVNLNENEVDNVFIFATIEESQYISNSYKINGQLVERHKVNDHLSKKVSIDLEQQLQVLDICNNDLTSIQEIFKNEDREMFKHLKITYDVKSRKMDSSFDYKNLLTGTDLTPHDIEDKWLKSLS